MFSYQSEISAGPNITEGARCASYAHYLADGAPVPDVSDRVHGPMTLRLRRMHVGGGTPGCMVWRNEFFRVVAIAGAKFPADQVQTIGGWEHKTRVQGLDGAFNQNAVAWALSVMTFIGPDLSQALVPTWIFGFSWGGSAACIVSQLIRNAYGASLSNAVTYGTPRFADQAAAGQFRDTCAMRMMAREDPLPFLCPTVDEAPFMHAGVGIFVSRVWETYDHINNGALLSPNGDLDPGLLPTGVPLPLDLNVYDFVRLNLGEGRPHAIHNYVNALSLRWPQVSADQMAVADQPAIGHSDLAPIEPRGKPTTTREYQRMVRSLIDTRASTLVHGAAAVVRRSDRKLISIGKQAGVWSVFIGNDRVYLATSKRDARGVANSLRALSVQVGQQPELFTRTDLVELLRSYQVQS